jgi:hypothetical protein
VGLLYRTPFVTGGHIAPSTTPTSAYRVAMLALGYTRKEVTGLINAQRALQRAGMPLGTWFIARF